MVICGSFFGIYHGQLQCLSTTHYQAQSDSISGGVSGVYSIVDGVPSLATCLMCILLIVNHGYVIGSSEQSAHSFSSF